MDPKNLKKEYTNGEVTIVWQSGKCTHSANCVKNNPDVFKPKLWEDLIKNENLNEITILINKLKKDVI